MKRKLKDLSESATIDLTDDIKGDILEYTSFGSFSEDDLVEKIAEDIKRYTTDPKNWKSNNRFSKIVNEPLLEDDTNG